MPRTEGLARRAAGRTRRRSTSSAPADTPGRGPSATSRPPDVSISWSPDAREFHLRNDHVSYVIRVNEDGSLRHLYFGAALGADGLLPHVETGGFAGFSNRVGDPVAFEYPTTGGGDYRI